MSHAFISHVEEDAEVALQIALGLEDAGYRTWCYELDSVPGISYLAQIGNAVEQSQVVIVVISPNSLGSAQVTGEVIRAGESAKHFVPVLLDITHAEFPKRQPAWREAIGSATSIRIPREGVAAVLARVIDGLIALDIHPVSEPDSRRIDLIRKAMSESRSRAISVNGVESEHLAKSVSGVFISHAEEDADIALQIALHLEEEGYHTWCYEAKEVVGADYRRKIDEAINECRAVILIISRHALESEEVSIELNNADVANKNFIPLFRGMTYDELTKLKPKWLQYLRGAGAINIDDREISRTIRKIVKGLIDFRIDSSGKADTKNIKEILEAMEEQRRNDELHRKRFDIGALIKSNLSGVAAVIGRNLKCVLLSAIALIVMIIAVFLVFNFVFRRESCDRIPMELVAQGEKFENNAFLSMESCGIPEKPEAVKFSWDLLNSGSYAGWTVNLPPELAKMAANKRYLVLSVQGQEGGGRFRIGLVDSGGDEVKVTVPLMPGDGRQISIPLHEFESQGFTLTNMQKLVLAFEYDVSDKGSVCIEQIGFCSQ